MEKIETGIYRLPDGRLYVHATAKSPFTAEIVHRRETLEPTATEDDARARRRELVAEIKRREVPSRDTLTLTDFARSWLRARMNSPRPFSPATAQTYARALEEMSAAMGAVDVSSITRPDVTRYRDHLEAMRQADGSRYATDTLRSWWRPMKRVLREAMADGYLSRDHDPTYMVEPPIGGPAVRESGTLSGEELAALLSATLLSCHWRRYPEVVMLAYTGMRPGEMYALRWSDIEGERIHIRRTVSAGKLRSTTKTGAARETYLAEPIATALDWQRGEMERLGRLDDLVFPTRSGGVRRPNAILKPLAEAAELAGIEQAVTPQVLRRTFNTLLMAAGVDRIVLRSIVGHSDEEMTARYSGVRHEDKRSAVLRIVKGGAES